MLPDVKIKDYYLQFIHNAKHDIVNYKNQLETTLVIKKELLIFEEH